MSAITAKASRKMKKYAVLTREPRCFLGSFDYSWEQRKVGDLLIERNQQAPMSDEYPLMAFIANEGVAPKGERYDRSALVTDTVNKLYKKTEKGDFIYSSNNLETGSIGLNKYGKACISPVYSIFEPTGIADSDFLGRRLVRKDFINAMVKWRQGVIYGQWRIHESDFLKIEIPVPSVEEQRKIGAYLDQLDNLITLHQRKCVFLFSFFRACISMNFTASTFSWEQRKLGELVDVCSGRDYKHLSEGTIPVYGTGGYMLSVNDALSYDRDAIGIGRKGTIDRPYILKAPFWTVDTLFYAIPREKADLNFAFDIFQNIDWKKKDESTGVPSLSKTAINDIDVLAPKHGEQQTIGQFFAAIDHLITLHQRECISFTGSAGRLILTANKKRTASSWEQRKLGDVVQITMGQSPDGSTYSDEPSDYILVQGNADLQNGWVCPRIWTTQITKKADAGDLIMSVRAPAGAMGKTAYNAVIGRGVAAIKGNEFIYQLLVKMDMDGFWKTLSCGSTFESLNSDNIKNAEVKVPTTAEQVQIGDFFRQLDNLITLHQRKGKAAVSGCSNDANNSKGVCCKARDFGYKCHKKDEPNRFDA